MRWLTLVLVLLLALLQYRLWYAEGSLAEQHRLQQQLQEQLQINSVLLERNQRLEVEVLELQSGLEALEERARSELNMIKEGEQFYVLPDAGESP